MSYRTLWNAFKRIAVRAGLSDGEKQLIFHDTAVRTYSLSAAIAPRAPAATAAPNPSNPSSGPAAPGPPVPKL